MHPPDSKDYLQLKQCAEALADEPENPVILERMGQLLTLMGQPKDALSSFWRSAIYFRQLGQDVNAARSCNKILEIDSNHEGALEMLNSLFPGKFTETLLDQRKLKLRPPTGSPLELPIGNEDLILEDTREIPAPPGVDSIKVKVASPPTPEATSPTPAPKQPHSGIMKPLSLRDLPPALSKASTSKTHEDPPSRKRTKTLPPLLANATEAPLRAPALKRTPTPETTKIPLAKIATEQTERPTITEVRRPGSHAPGEHKKNARQRKLAVTQPVPPGHLSLSAKKARQAKNIQIESTSPAIRAHLDTTEKFSTPQMAPDPFALTTLMSKSDQAESVSSILPSYFLDQGIVRHFIKNEYIFREKDSSTELYLIENGAVEVTKKARGMRRRKLATLEAGDCFGELALLGDGIRHTTAKATMAGTLRVFRSSQIKALMAQNPDFSRELRKIYRHRLQIFLLKISSIFAGLPKNEAITFVRRCKPLALKTGQIVVEEGSPATGFYIVLLGQLEVTVRPKKGGGEKILGKLSDGDFFGEISLVYDQPTTATIKTCGFTQLLQMSAGEFHRFVNSNQAFMKIIETEAKRREKNNRAILRGTAKFDDLKGVVFTKDE